MPFIAPSIMTHPDKSICCSRGSVNGRLGGSAAQHGEGEAACWMRAETDSCQAGEKLVLGNLARIEGLAPLAFGRWKWTPFGGPLSPLFRCPRKRGHPKLCLV